MPSGFWRDFSHTLVSLLPCQLKYNVFGFICKWAEKKEIVMQLGPQIGWVMLLVLKNVLGVGNT